MLVVGPRYSLALSSLALALSYSAMAHAQEPCFERIDTGTDTSGWHPSTTNHHGPGTGWTVEGGALVGRQTGNQQQGGILLTDKLYQDVEVIFQVKIDWGCDSGFFFRTTAGDRAYQVNVDHLAESGVGTIYGESFAQELRAIPYWLTNNGSAAIVAPDQNSVPIFDLASWPTIWHPTEFNEIRARVEGNPPHMQVWISGTKVMDFTDGMQRGEIEATGPLAIQVHSGGRWIPGGSVAYKNIRVKDLTAACDDPGGGGGGAGGTSGAGGSNAGSGGVPGAGAGGGGNGSGGSGGATNASGGTGLAGGGASGASGGGVVAGSPPSGNVAGSPPSPVGGASTAPPPAGSEDNGCSCSVPASRSSSAALWALLGLAGIARLRCRWGRTVSVKHSRNWRTSGAPE